MADIRAFRGLLYDSSVTGDISRLVAPPYDVISEEERERLLRSHPLNVVRLILPEERGPLSGRLWQARAREYFEEWKENGVFKFSSKPSIYIYRQNFPLPGGPRKERLALIALYKIEGFGERGIFPHEQTFPEVTEEQLNLLRQCRASFSQIFSLFKDDEAFWRCIEEKALPLSTELYNFSTDDGIWHELRELSDMAAIGELRRHLEDKTIFIADGHHRYETALIFRDEQRASEKAKGERPYDFTIMALVGINDPGLVMLPVHRLVRIQDLSPEEALQKLESSCFIQRVGDCHNREALTNATAQVIGETGKSPVYGLITEKGIFLVRPKGRIMAENVGGQIHSERWRMLDIAILHEVLFRKYLGLQDSVNARKAYSFKYTIDTSEMVEEILSGSYQMGFLVKPPSLEDAWAISTNGERLPHKSTYFYPKIPSGLVIYDHAIGYFSG